MKRILNAVLAVAIVAMGFGAANAIQTSSGTVVRVTVAPGLSVSIDAPEVNFGSLGTGINQIAAASATVKNDTTGRIEDYTIDCSSSASWEIEATGNPATDQFSMQAVFKNTVPADGDFTGNCFFNATVGGQNMLQPAFGTSGYDGNNVTKNALRALWFKIYTPQATTTQAQQSMTVTVTAVDAASF